MTDPSTASTPSTGSGTGSGIEAELARLRAEVAELRAEVTRLDGDLDESRRLNLRAAELLDIVYETLERTQGLS